MSAVKKIVKSGLMWSGLAQLIIQLVKVGKWVFLLYFLTPEDFGLFAIGLLIIGLPQTFLDEGVSSAVIQSPEELTDRDLSTFHWLLSGFSACLLIMFTLFSGFIANFFTEPELVYLLIFLSGSNFIESFGKISNALLRKSLQFKFLAQIETLAFLLNTFLTLILAYLGYGVWALAYGLVSSHLSATVCYLYKANFRMKGVFSSQSIRKIYTFSRDLTIFRFLTYLMRYTDDFIIGYFFGKASLGIYDRAYQIVHMPMRLIANRINSVLFPAYSKEDINSEERKEVHLKILHYASAFYIPLLGGILLFAEVGVNIFLPEEWSQLSFYLSVLAVGGIIHAFLNFNESLFLAKGRSDLQLKYGLFTRGIIVFAYLIGLFWGVKGIAVGYTIGSFFAFFPESQRALKEINTTLQEFWKALRPALFYFIPVVAILYLILFLVNKEETYLLLGGAIYSIVCGIFAILFFRNMKQEF